MADETRVTPEQQVALDGLRDAIVACDAAAATATAERVPGAGVLPAAAMKGVAVARFLVSTPGGAHA